MTWRDPQAGPAGRAQLLGGAASRRVRLVWPVVVLFLAVIGGIYAGVFTATEGAGHRPPGARLRVRASRARALTWRVFVEVLIESVRTTSMLFMILIGALIFANFINYTTMAFGPQGLRHSVSRCTRSW